MTDKFPNSLHINEPIKDPVFLIPKAGIDGFATYLFDIDNQLGITLVVKTETLGDFHVPIVSDHVHMLRILFDQLDSLTPDDIAAALAELRKLTQ